MPGAGFIGAGAPGNRRRRRGGVAQSITASVLPASSVLTVGQSLSETVNWPIFLSLSNYTASAPGESITDVEVNYIGSTASAAEPLADGETNLFSITVTDSAGITRSFTTVPRIVVHIAPAVVGVLTDQSVTLGVGVQSYATAAAFAGADLSFSVSGPAGVSIDAATGDVSFDTDVLSEGADLPVTVTAANSGGSASLGFALTVEQAIVYGASITGLVDNPTHGLTAEIGSALTGQITPLTGSETVVHRWRLEGTLIAGAVAATYTPAAGEDLGQVQYTPLVNGTEVASAAYRVRHVPPVAGALAPVDTVEGGGLILVNLAPGFSGENLSFSETVGWASISGSTLSIDDAVRSDTVTITAQNSGGQAAVSLDVTVAPLLVTLIAPLQDQTLQQGSGDLTIDLATVFANATGYAVTGAGATLDSDGVTLRLETGNARTGEIISVTASNANGSLSEQFTLDVVAVLETDLVMTIETTAADESFRLLMHPLGIYDGTVDMGNGAGPQGFNSASSPAFTAIYATPGIHTIRVSGRAGALRFNNNSTHAGKVRTVENLGTLGWASFQSAFRGCSGMTSFVAGNTDTSGVENFFQMFELCRVMTTCDITGMDFSSAINLQNTWAGCWDLPFLDTTVIDTGNVQRMDEMLYRCYALAPPDISGFNLQSLIGPGGMAQFFERRADNPRLTQAVYDAFLTNLAGQTLPTVPSIAVELNDSPYTTGGAVEAIRRNLIETLGWQIVDAGNARPETPAAPQAVANGETAITVTLPADPFGNGRRITARDLRYSTDEVSWTEQADFTSGEDLTGLSSGTTYFIQWRARNFNGASDWSASVEVSTGGVATFSRVVFIGASIMQDIAGDTLSTRNTPFETAFQAQGATVEVYSRTQNGDTAAETGALLTEAMAAFPADTLFFVHTGGNNVSANRPHPGGASALTTALSGLVDIAATRPGSVILSDLTFRDYDGSTAADEAAGAKPYNDNVYLPLFLARKSDLAEQAYYADGTPVSCLYEWTYYNRATYLSSDNVHPSTGGIAALRGWLAERLAPICTGEAIPAQATRLTLDVAAPLLSSPTGAGSGTTGAVSLGVITNEGGGTLYWGIYPATQSPVIADVVAGTGAALAGSQPVTVPGAQQVPDQIGLTPATEYRACYVHQDAVDNRSAVAFSDPFMVESQTLSLDVFVDYGNGATPGVNTPPFVPGAQNAGATSDGPFALLNSDGSDPGVTLTLNFSAASPGGSSGFGLNFFGRSSDSSAFSGTLYNDVFTADSYFVGAAYSVDHVISGLSPDTGYTVELIASRAASGVRETLYSFSGGETATIQTTANPVQDVVTVETTSDGAGVITITQSANSGSWSYLGGLHIFGSAAAKASLSVENLSEEPVISAEDGTVSVTIASGPYAGTYTQRITDGAPLSVAMIAAAPTPIVLPSVTGVASAGDTVTITPGLWLYDGPDPGDQTWVQTLDGAPNGETDLDYITGPSDAGKIFAVDETFAGVTITSAGTQLTFT